MTTVVAAVADKNGNIKRLNNYFIKFEIEGDNQLRREIERLKKAINLLKIKEVEQQQEEFGEK